MDNSCENLVIEALMYDIAKSISPDDVGQHMMRKGLLLPQEYVRFIGMIGRHHQHNFIDLNKFLLDCLKLRDPGYLNEFCAILKELKGSQIVEVIRKKHEELKEHASTSGITTCEKCQTLQSEMEQKTKSYKKEIRDLRDQNDNLKNKMKKIHNDFDTFFSTHFPDDCHAKYPISNPSSIDSSSSCDPRDTPPTNSDQSESSFPLSSVHFHTDTNFINSGYSTDGSTSKTLVPFPGLKSGRNTDIELDYSSHDEAISVGKTLVPLPSFKSGRNTDIELAHDEKNEAISVSDVQPGKHVFHGDFHAIMKDRRTLVDKGTMPESIKCFENTQRGKK